MDSRVKYVTDKAKPAEHNGVYGQGLQRCMAIDDFGTGYSSLNLLRDFSADVLKLDKSFIDGHTDTKRDSVVVSNVAKMARELDMSVITEGVESWEQVEFLKSVNINMVQGYLFNKPLPKEAFEQRLRTKHYD